MKNRITLTEEDFITLVSNNLIFKGLKFSCEDLLELITGNIVEIDNNLIILQDIGFHRISDILDKYRKI